MKKETKSSLQREYSYYESFFIAFMVAAILFAFNFIKEVALLEMTFYEMVLNLTILIMLGLLARATENSKEEIRKKLNSKK